MKDPLNIDWIAFAAGMDALAKQINKAAEDLTRAISQWADEHAPAILMAVQRAYETLYLDEPMPGEEPVDYVMRVGARSGFFIYPDEAWRYRANLDWWNERKH